MVPAPELALRLYLQCAEVCLLAFAQGTSLVSNFPLSKIILNHLYNISNTQEIVFFYHLRTTCYKWLLTVLSVLCSPKHPTSEILNSS